MRIKNKNLMTEDMRAGITVICVEFHRRMNKIETLVEDLIIIDVPLHTEDGTFITGAVEDMFRNSCSNLIHEYCIIIRTLRNMDGDFNADAATDKADDLRLKADRHYKSMSH